MRNWKLYLLAFTATALMSGPVVAQINFADNFESYTLNTGGDDGPIGGGWLVFANVFGDYPGCSANYLYGYGPFAAPNKTGGFSNIVEGETGQALNAFSDYDNGDHANGFCIESNIFQEVVFSAADAGTYDFIFDTQIQFALEGDARAYGFIKLLDPNDGFKTVLFKTVSTTSGGIKSISVTLDASDDGKILQWGFASTASNYEASGRVYDSVTFAPQQDTPPGSEDSFEGVPTLNTYGLLVLLLVMGATAAIVLVRRS
jgi:hypothetical protein